MQKMLDKLVAWGRTCGLIFNPQKTVAIMFTRKIRTFQHQLVMDGVHIPYSDSVVYLGVTLDKKLRWKDHILNKIKKTKSLLMKMSHITKSYWGPQPKLMRWTYTGIVRPVLTYAAMTWGHEIDHPYIKARLRKLNRLAINTITKVPRSTPTRALEIILGVLPLQVQIYREGMAAHVRLRSQLPLEWEGVYKNKLYSVSHRKYWELLAEDWDLHNTLDNTDEGYAMAPAARYIVDTNSFVEPDYEQKEVHCNVYTDGSKMSTGVGAGVHIKIDNLIINERFKLPEYATVFQAEILAIREAAYILQTLRYMPTIKFFVDSQAALLALQSSEVSSRLVLQTMHAVNEIVAGSKIFVWTKAHVGTPGNERADQLAKEATLLTNEVAIPPPASTLKNTLDDAAHKLWNKQWENYNEARQSKIFHPSFNKSTTAAIIQWPRLKLGRYIRAVTRHNNLLYHLHNIDNSISPACRFCLEAYEQFVHLAYDCPALWSDQQSIEAMVPETVGQCDWNFDQIIAFIYIPRIDEAFAKPLFMAGTTSQQDQDDIHLMDYSEVQDIHYQPPTQQSTNQEHDEPDLDTTMSEGAGSDRESSTYNDTTSVSSGISDNSNSTTDQSWIWEDQEAI